MQRILLHPTSSRSRAPKGEALLKEIKLILLNCASDPPDLEMLANAFSISGRSLRRQLAESGTSYQKMLNSARCHLATQFLQQTKMATEEISEELGFTDVSNFRHAFKRWTGTSPAAFRNQRQVA